jgi:hypothetical protein
MEIIIRLVGFYLKFVNFERLFDDAVFNFRFKVGKNRRVYLRMTVSLKKSGLVWRCLLYIKNVVKTGDAQFAPVESPQIAFEFE